MNVICFTNLDLCHCENFPRELPVVPAVGDLIESSHEWEYNGGKTKLTLRVVRVTWKFYKTYFNKYGNEVRDVWVPQIELTLPSYFENMRAFYEWYGRVTGRGVQAFI